MQTNDLIIKKNVAYLVDLNKPFFVDYKSKDTDFICDINGKQIPETMKCIYDTDEIGFTVGCRDGSHLNDCGLYITISVRIEIKFAQS